MTALKNISLLFFVFLSLQAMGQVSDSIKQKYKIEKVDPAELRVLYSFYEQDGDHSAVNGGQGNEYLNVHAAKVKVYLPMRNKNTLSMDLGLDVITSASTDRIDFNRSSASRKDARTSVGLGYSKYWEKIDLQLGGSLNGSVESDYLGRGIGVYIQKGNQEKGWVMRLGYQGFFDDLRWGWLNPDDFTGQFLIYPAELRGQSWFDTFTRHTHAISFNYQQIINPRLQSALTTDLVYQNGLLSTPFHRVFFQDEFIPVVENLPQLRRKLALGFRLNYFLADSWVVRSFNRFYVDDFGILSYTLELEFPYKLSPRFSLYPFGRFYVQRGAHYFRRFKDHLNTATFYTSDFDLSSFTNYKFGLGFKYSLFSTKGKNRIMPRELNLRYAHYSRSDGLFANIISFGIRFQFRPKSQGVHRN